MVVAAATLLTVTGAGALVLYGSDGTPRQVLELIQGLEEQEREAKQAAEEYSQRHTMGETFELTGYDANKPEHTSYERSYLKSLGWYGTLEWTITGAKKASTLAEVGVPAEVEAELGLPEWAEDEPVSFLSVEAEITNVDAVSDNVDFTSIDDLIRPSCRVYPCDAEGNPSDEMRVRYVDINDYWQSASPDYRDVRVDSYMQLPAGEAVNVRMVFMLRPAFGDAFTQEDFESLEYALVFDSPNHFGSCAVNLGEL